MTWIRWECKTPNHELIAALAEELHVRRAEAHGLYAGTCCGFGEHQPDGDAAAVRDGALEKWADWQGKPGRFAAVFRALCLETRPEQADAVGAGKGWWRQAALLREQERRRLRPGQGSRRAAQGPRKGREKAARGPTAAFAVPSRGNGNVYELQGLKTTSFDLVAFEKPWRTLMGGAPHRGRLRKALKPVVAELGEPETLARWCAYLDRHQGDERKYVSPESFAAKHGLYAEARTTTWLATDDLGVDRKHRRCDDGRVERQGSDGSWVEVEDYVGFPGFRGEVRTT